MVKYQVELKELVVGFMERNVGIDPRDPRSKTPKFLLEEVEKYRKVNAAREELRGHLKDVSSDKTAKVMACVNQMQGDAYQKAAAEHARNVSKEAKELSDKMMSEFHGFLLQQEGVEKNVDDATNQQVRTLYSKFLAMKGIGNAAAASCSSVVTPESNRKRKAGESMALANKKDRRGTKTIPNRGRKIEKGADLIVHWDTIMDTNTSDYIDKDRQFLLRIKRPVHCFRRCCNRDATLFMAKYAPGKATFQLKDFKKGCQSCI